MSNFPTNVPRDDATSMLDAEGSLFDTNESDPIDDQVSGTEDPVTRGQSKAGRHEMFVPHAPIPRSRIVRGGNAQPRSGGFRLTPGARNIP